VDGALARDVLAKGAVATIVALHAHPDDETIIQAGTLAKYVDAGHRVVIVYATRGELGEVPDGLLEPGETLVERRVLEAERSAAALGTARIVWLDYGDSGMAGLPDNDNPACFWRADVEEAAARVAGILREEGAEVLLSYDEQGNYGHPDHLQVHRVGARAGELAGTPHVLEATISRDHVRMLLAQVVATGVEPDDDWPDVDNPDFVLGMPDARITTRIDVTPWLARKRAAMAAHATQVGDLGMFLAMDDDTYRMAMGTEFFIRRGVPAGHRDHDLFVP
jgi:LmbE family N-acetylglucosaminyl deacetylase